MEIESGNLDAHIQFSLIYPNTRIAVVKSWTRSKTPPTRPRRRCWQLMAVDADEDCTAPEGRCAPLPSGEPDKIVACVIAAPGLIARCVDDKGRSLHQMTVNAQ